jgi:4-amino-4-deoxy-L-arabinose transferase-like glycosyltransferase
VWDGHYYHFGAERIAEGLGYSEDVTIGGVPVWKPWTHYPVGYSGLLAIAYKIFGSGILTAPVVNAFIGTMTVVVVHRLARYALSQHRARLAGTLCALHPGLIAYSAVVMTEPAAALFVLGAVWAALALRTQHRGYVVTGILLGIGSLIRPASLLFLPVLLFLGPRPFWKSMLRAGAAGVIALLTIAPWSYRNCRVMDGCALVSTNGGWNLAIGALTETGRFRTLRADDGCPVVTGQVQQDRCWADVGVRIIGRDPEAWFAKVPAKLSQTYNHESFPIEYLREASPDLWPEDRRLAGRDLLTVFHWLLMTATAFSPIALITSTRRRISTATQSVLLLATAAYASYCFATTQHPFFALMVLTPFVALLHFPGRPSSGPAGRILFGLLLITTLTHAIFFGEDRYHLVISPVLCVLAAGALRLRGVPAEWARG